RDRIAAFDRAIYISAHVSQGEKDAIDALDAQLMADQPRQRRALIQLAQKFPRDPRVHVALGRFFATMQEYGAAQHELEQAIVLRPTFPPPHHLLSTIYRATEDYASAEAACKKYIELLPKEAHAYAAYGELLLKLGRFDDANGNFDRA